MSAGGFSLRPLLAGLAGGFYSVSSGLSPARAPWCLSVCPRSLSHKDIRQIGLGPPVTHASLIAPTCSSLGCLVAFPPVLGLDRKSLAALC